MTKGEQWRNRIVGEGVQVASQFVANPANWRVHPQAQRDAMRGALNEVGWVQRVIVNRRTGYLIDGHERVWQALQNGDALVPYVEVDLSPEEEAYVLATLDPIGAMAQASTEQLGALLAEVSSAEAGVQAMLEQVAEKAGLYGEDSNYSRKIEPPVYEPTGASVPVEMLYDDSRTQELLRNIDAAGDMPEEVRRFLRIAAQRHTVLHFKHIAEFYASAPPDVQRLMEDSALVVVDFDRAIEMGFVRLTARLAEQVGKEYPEDDDEQ